jgi:hypothetical protein
MSATCELSSRFVYLDTGEIFEADADGNPASTDVPFCTFTSLEDEVGPTFAAAPDLIAAAQLLNRDARPCNWDDDEDPDQKAAWLALDAALLKAGLA